MDFNLVAVIAGAISNMVVGTLWYGPIFGKRWTKLEGWTKADMEAGKDQMPKTYFLTFVGAFLMALVLSTVISFMGTSDIMSGARAGFWTWAGFAVPVLLNEVLFGRKKWEVFYLNIGYYLVSLVLMGIVITVLA